jgi:putative cardiolipin synthase
VRLLVDDFYTAGVDPLLQGLAAHANVEVRLFNPFASRATSAGRMLNMAMDFKRLNHRMHNKLFLADGAVAIAGGRNMADGYFLRGPDTFIDFDALAVGAVVPQLQSIFDNYWNSPHVYGIAAVAPSSESPAALRAHFDAVVNVPSPEPVSVVTTDVYGAPLLSVDLTASLQQLIWAETTAFADNPDKVVRETTLADFSNTTMYHSMAAFREARSELMLFSPYFVPGRVGMEGLKTARDYGVPVRIITNSMATTDEPLASLAYERYRIPLLKLGIDLFELRPLLGSPEIRNGPGASRSRWHAKMAFINRKTMILGSMNLDQRSATTNTEVVLRIDSPEFVERVLQYFNATRSKDVNHVYQVKLKPDGSGLEWVALKGEGRTEVLDSEPDMDYLLRLRLWLLSPFVSEDLL